MILLHACKTFKHSQDKKYGALWKKMGPGALLQIFWFFDELERSDSQLVVGVPSPLQKLLIVTRQLALQEIDARVNAVGTASERRRSRDQSISSKADREPDYTAYDQISLLTMHFR